MHILLVGLNHKTAPLEVREKVFVPKERLPSALAHFSESVGVGVILSTCNRTEIYSVAERSKETAVNVRRFVTEYGGLTQEAVSPHLYDYSDADATRHLFRVASGLDSMILGESEILGQVRQALVAGAESQSLQLPLSRLFHGAIRTGRRVREETEVGRNPLSISYAGVQLAQRILGSLAGLRALLIGAGEAGHLVARALRTSGVSDMMVANRTQDRASELAKRLAGRMVQMSDVPDALKDADIVIAATEAPEYVIDQEMALAAAQNGRDRPLFLFDLSLPRNIDPEVASIDNLRLFNIDDLWSIAEENLETRKAAAEDAERIVDAETSRFMEWWDSLEAVELIKTLHKQGEEIRRRELERALRKLSTLPREQRDVVEALTRSIVEKLLHDPTESLKRNATKAQLQTIRELFRLTREG